MNYYELLGIRLDATPMEMNAALQAFKDSGVFERSPLLELEVTGAYQTLIDPYEKHQYNQEQGLIKQIIVDTQPSNINHNYYNIRNHNQESYQPQAMASNLPTVLNFYMYFAIGFSVILCVGSIFF